MEIIQGEGCIEIMPLPTPLEPTEKEIPGALTSESMAKSPASELFLVTGGDNLVVPQGNIEEWSPKG